MKKIFISLFIIFYCSSLYAEWLEDIFNSALRMEGLQGTIIDKQSKMLGIQHDILSSQRDIQNLMSSVQKSVTGSSGQGTYQFHDYQSYGGSANDWANVMRMADAGEGSGELGAMMKNLSGQFPADRAAFNRGVNDDRQQKYYAMQVQTILAARAASHLDYNKIEDQIQYQQMLQQKIETTKDLKAAMDLNNRLQVEGNLIELEVLRQVALVNQQQAVTDQAAINTALANAQFLTKE